MKRNIKFRGKAFPVSINSWVYGSFIQYADDCWIQDENGTQYKVDSDTVGQFTGLYDKDEKEIYEGDILRISRTDTEESLLAEVYDRSIVRIPMNSECDYMLLDFLSACCEFEVMGNIHDNPELLEGGYYEE